MDKVRDLIMLDRTENPDKPSFWREQSDRGMVTAAHYRASEAGREILSLGGNAFDAAVALSVALGVVEPSGSGLGGMAMALLYLAEENKTLVLEGSCRAPLNATPEQIAASPRKLGYKSAAVPTLPALLATLSRKYGSMSLERVLEPVISLAEKGFLITPLQSLLRKEYLSSILKGNAMPFLLDRDSKPPEPGSLMKQQVLAETIKTLRVSGFEDFYTGEVGRKILLDMERNEGFISRSDFEPIPYPNERKPLRGSYKSWSIETAPPPGGGVALLEMLNLFEELETDGFDPDTPEGSLLFASIIRKVREDRRKHRYMPIDLSQRKGPDLTSKEYAAGEAESLLKESGLGETTHFNIVDKQGNIVCLTQSIERSFGSKMATENLGFLYNGFMKAFKIENRKHPYYLRPGLPARSNAAPTIVLREGAPYASLGSTGSERSTSGIFQVLIRLFKGQDPFDAVKAPRLHCTPEGTVFLEEGRFSSGTVELLRKKGFEIHPYDTDWSFSAGGLNLIAFSEGMSIGVSDPRRDGSAAGLR